jgi:phenylpyruvate tautomerase PptA (4-oxalocrotonate tautomerase family)
MPSVNITLREGTSAEYKKAVSDAIHHAMIEAFAIPEDDRFHVFHEKRPEDMLQEPVSFGIERTPRCMLIQLAFNERTPEAKQALYESIVRHLGTEAGVPIEDIMIMVIETARENWWVHGRIVNPQTGYDARMQVVGTPADS